MISVILKFELKQWLRNPLVYIYTAVFFLMTVGSMAGAAGIMGEGSSSQNTANSPLSLFSFFLFFFKLLLFLLPAICGASIYKDFSSGIHSILYSYPFGKFDYLTGKFASSFLIVIVISFAVGAGLAVGAMLPGTDPSLLVPFDIFVYMQIYTVYVLPNLLLFGSAVFAIVLFSRNIYAGFIGVVLLLLLRETALNISGPGFGILFDPLGTAAAEVLSVNLSQAERSALPVPFDRMVLYNRLIWFGVTIFILAVTYFKFRFAETASFFLKSGKAKTEATVKIPGRLHRINIPLPVTDFSFTGGIKTAWLISKFDFRYILRSGSFISILAAGGVFTAVILLQVNPVADTKILPVTWAMLGYPVMFISFLILFLTFLYSGVLMNRADSYRMNELVISSPVKDSVLLLSRILALVKMQSVLLIMIMAVGVSVQIYSGYYSIDPLQYLFALFGIHLIVFVIWSFISLFVQSVFRNSYLGLFVLILFALGITYLPSAGIEQAVFRFNQDPEPYFFLKYSDLTGYADFLFQYFIYKLYWLLFGLVLFSFTLLVFPRELIKSQAERFKLAVSRFRGKTAIASIVLAVSFLFAGYMISYVDSLGSNSLSSEREAELYNDFLTKYSRFGNTPQPRITSVRLKIDIYPEERSFFTEGEYMVVNKTNTIIDTLLIRTGFDEVTTLSIDGNSADIKYDSIYKFGICVLKTPLAPGDSMKFSFTIRNSPGSLFQSGSGILPGGTYLKSDILPRLGFYCGTNSTPVAAGSNIQNHYQGNDADHVDLDIIAGTSPEQTVILPGKLVNETSESGRRYFHYKTESSIKFVFGIVSGIYEKYEEVSNGTKLSIYYHKEHDKNTTGITDALKRAMEYNSLYFSPYPYGEIIVAEFPRSAGSYATTSGNVIQMSEIRFIGDPGEQKDGLIDLAFYTAAHELSHQWWGNQVMPADAPGAVMLTESICEYVTAKVYEKKFGKQQALKFLKIQMNRYLSGRANDTGTEPPLMNVEPEQSYISYGKGAVVFYSIAEFIGEENLNCVLGNFLRESVSQKNRYPATVDLVRFIDQATPDSLKYLITDMFQTVTFYENKIGVIKKTPLPGGKYKVDVDLTISKYRINDKREKTFSDDSGKSISFDPGNGGSAINSLPLNDYFEIAILDSRKNTLYRGKIKVSSIYNNISIIVASNPESVLIDPDELMIEVNKSNNKVIF
ncbi:MAG: hypothetical protein IAE90_02100 [Ignavibacteria bacterium]|nr:hypothetical protein [Ignavibacteria bacterium]